MNSFMNQIVTLKPDIRNYIWTPSALVGKELKPEKDILLEISGGRIETCQSVRKDDLPKEIRGYPFFYALDEGLTLLPALIDAHVHLALDGIDFNRAREQWDDCTTWQARVEGDIEKTLCSGIAAVRDGGDVRELNLKVKKQIQKRMHNKLKVSETGRAVRVKGGYGSFLGREYESAGSIPGLVEMIASSGVDQLKVVVSGVVSFCQYGMVKGPIMPAKELDIIVEKAHSHGLKVMAHASSAGAVERAARVGVDSIEHGYFVRPETLQLMAEKNIAWVPTIIPVAAQTRDPFFKLWTTEEIDIITRTYEEHIGKLKLALELGVPLGVGTDAGAAGVRHGSCLLEELLLYAQGGLSNREILQAATFTNATILGLEKELGTLALGLKASFIAVNGNPLEDLNALKALRTHFVS
ncbi:MAG: amidohydrolase family protein [Bacillota bacterium]